MEDSYVSESEDNKSYISSKDEGSHQSSSDNIDKELNSLNSKSRNIVTQKSDDDDSVSLKSSNSKSGNIVTQKSDEDDSVSSYEKTQDNKIYQKSIDKFVNQALGNEENKKRKKTHPIHLIRGKKHQIDQESI